MPKYKAKIINIHEFVVEAKSKKDVPDMALEQWNTFGEESIKKTYVETKVSVKRHRK